jgi:hypothetical protein
MGYFLWQFLDGALGALFVAVAVLLLVIAGYTPSGRGGVYFGAAFYMALAAVCFMDAWRRRRGRQNKADDPGNESASDFR